MSQCACTQLKIVCQEFVMVTCLGVVIADTAQPWQAKHYRLKPVKVIVWSLVKPGTHSTGRRASTCQSVFFRMRVTKNILFSLSRLNQL
jgi:hypothetical protein